MNDKWHTSRRSFLGMGAMSVFALHTGITSAIADEKQWQLRIQCHANKNPDDAQWVSPAKLLDFVKEETGGRVDLRAFASGQLVPYSEIANAIGNGVIDGGTFTGNYVYGQVPALDWAGQPICNTREEWFQVMEAGGRAYIDEQLAKMNMVAIGIYPIDDIIIFASKKGPIKTLADFNGLRMRGPGGIINKFMENQGAGVTIMNVADTTTALQTGVLDGLNTALTGYTTFKGWEIAPFETWAKGLNITVAEVIAISKDAWDSFPGDIQTSIRRAEARHREWDAPYFAQFKLDTVAMHKSMGTTVTILEPDEAAKWREAYLKVSIPGYLETGEQAKYMIDFVEKTLGRKYI